MTETALTVTEPQEFLPIKQTPSEVVEDAREKAKVLQDIVRQAGLAQKFGAKEYLMAEAWQTIGKFYGCTAVVEWTKPIMDDGKIMAWEAKANVVDIDGVIRGSAEHMCSMDEKNWKGRDQYAIRSMAQTRATAKALRLVFAWVAVLAGYSATPAEEMQHEFVDVPVTEKQASYIEKKVGKAFDTARDISEFYKFLKEKIATIEHNGKQVFTKEGASDIIEHFTAYEEEFKQQLEHERMNDEGASIL